METGQAISLVAKEENIYLLAYTPIHKYIQRLIPYLEQRQEVAKRFYQQKGKSSEADENYEKMIEWGNNEILNILNIMHDANAKNTR